MFIIETLQPLIEENLSLLTPVEQAWQPSDFLPDLTAEDWSQRLAQFRESAQRLPSDLLVVLVGNMVTEEALPNYAISLEHVAQEPTGTSDAPWAQWLRGWTAEENRHGDLLNAYLRLSGRVDMKAVERTVHHLIRNGFSQPYEGEIYEGLIYTSFQERATRLSHGSLARLAHARGGGEPGADLPQDRRRRGPPRGVLHEARRRAVPARAGGDDDRLPRDAQAPGRDARRADDRRPRPRTCSSTTRRWPSARGSTRPGTTPRSSAT